jgi:hypothetical protein
VLTNASTRVDARSYAVQSGIDMSAYQEFPAAAALTRT